MRLFQTIAPLGVCLALVESTVAAPADDKTEGQGNAAEKADPSLPGQQAKSTFTLSQIKNPQFNRLSGLEAMIAAFSKYNVPLTPELKHAASINAVRETPETHKRANKTQSSGSTIPPMGNDFEFLVPVSIGSPPQNFKLDLDTGSADLWVLSTETQATLAGQDVYNPGKSTTAQKQNGSTWRISYGDGSGATGNVYNDIVTIGGISSVNQTVQTAVYVSDVFTSDPNSSGLLGMAMSNGSTVRPQKALTFMDSIRDSLAEPLFTANLKHGVVGNYNFGFIDHREYTGSIHYVPADKQSTYWQFTVDGHSIGPQPSSKTKTYSYSAIADTGTTLLLLPPQVVVDYYSQVERSGFEVNYAAMIFPCDSVLPDFAFVLGKYRGVVPGRCLNYGYLPENPNFCYGGMQSSGGVPFSVFGDILLKAQFVVFDAGKKRIGFANKNVV